MSSASIYEILFVSFIVLTTYSVYSIFRRNRSCLLHQQQLPQLPPPPQPTINNYTPLLPPIIIRCDTFDRIEKQNNTSFESCAICLEKYELASSVAILENCKHMFHDQCITDWFKRSYNCPLCNK